MRKILSGIAMTVALTSSALAGDIAPIPKEVPEAGPLGLIALGIVGVAIAYRLRNRK